MLSTPLRFKFSLSISKKPLFIFAIAVVSFGFLFGIAGGAFAANLGNCSAVGGWQGTTFSCDVTYQDMGGSDLTTCEYKLFNTKTVPGGHDTGWLSAGTCSGSSSTLTVSITVGSSQNCRDQGTGACELSANAKDSSGNIIQPFPTVIKNFNIDYTLPTTTIQCNGTTCSSTWYTANVAVGLSTSTTASPDTIYECQDQSNSCSPVSRTTGTPSASYSFSLSTEGTDYVRYNSQDSAGNNEALQSTTIKIDKTAPTISSFIVSPLPPLWVNLTTPATISWIASDTGGSGMNHYELYRAPDVSGSPGTWAVVFGKDNLSSATTSTTDTPLVSGIYWYGLHAVDVAGNCITENTSDADKGHSCGGVTFDDFDRRPDKGPTKVQVDIAKPVSSITNPPAGSSQNRPKFSPDATFQYQDSGSSNLAACEYRVESNGVQTFPASGWQSAGACSGAGPVNFTKTITVGFNASDYCKDAGTNKCALFVRATDAAGNVGDASQASYTIVMNQPPSISSVLLLPVSPFKASATFAFNANWTDPESDPVQLFVCKSNFTPSGGNCLGGSPNNWCKTSALAFTVPALCNYTTQASDEGTKNYYVFVCDDNNACSSSIIGTTTGTFLVDAHAPTISSFAVSPVVPLWVNSANPNVTVSWTVSDTGGSHLQNVTFWRASYGAGCDDSSKASCSWLQVGSTTAPVGSDGPWTSSLTLNDNPSEGTYWYGMHVLDNVNYEVSEGALGVKKVQVDKTAPPKPTCDPAGGTFLNSVSVTCSDTEGGVTIRYTENGTPPTTSSPLYTSALTITSTEPLSVAAWDAAGNKSQIPDNAYGFTITHNTPPQAVSLQDDHLTANYCSTTGSVIPPPITLSWQYQDPDAGAYESAYQVQISTDNFSTILFDTGKVSDPVNTIHNGDRKSYAPPAGTFSYNTTYYWRVRVWDDQSAPSSFVRGSSFPTPSHYYPIPDFIWSPASPSANEQVQFTDQTNFSPSSSNKSWSWDFGDSSSLSLQNPTHKYTQIRSYAVSLTSSDNAGTCSKSKPLNIGIPFPQWQEISPF